MQGRKWVPMGISPEAWASGDRPSPHRALLLAIATQYPSISAGMAEHWAGRCSLFARKWDGASGDVFADVALPHLSLETAADVARRRLSGEVPAEQYVS